GGQARFRVRCEPSPPRRHTSGARARCGCSAQGSVSAQRQERRGLDRGGNMGTAQPHRIVVADDAPTFRRYLAGILRQRHYTVLEAKNGAEAVELIRRELPDLAIFDLWMPGMNGMEATRTLAED